MVATSLHAPHIVEATMNYIESGDERPANYLYDPEPGYRPPPPPAAKHKIGFEDARSNMGAFTLDTNGFAFLQARLPSIDFLDDEVVQQTYYVEVANLVQAATGAQQVLCFDHNVRDRGLAALAGSGVREPVRFAHNDYTEVSAPQRVIELLPDTGAEVLKRRYLFVNLWRPLRGPVIDTPLAVCDAGSLSTKDFVATDLIYADRTGEIYSIKYREGQRWYYLQRMETHEILLLKCFDSATDGRARYTAHAAFRDPRAAKHTLPRRSIEVRTLVMF